MQPILSNYVRQQRFKAVAPHLRGAVLDLGCGHAGITAVLQPGQVYVGVEGHPQIYQWLLEHFPRFEFYERNLDVDLLAIERAFDSVLMLAIIEHLRSPAHLLRQVPAYLKPGGQVLITTPTPGGGILHAMGARLGLFYREASEEHHTFFDLPGLQPLLEAAGLRVTHYTRFLFGWNQLLICKRSE